MNRAAFVIVIAIVAIVGVTGAFIFLSEDNNDRSDPSVIPDNPDNPDKPEQTSKNLKIRNTLEVGDWVTLTIPCKGNPFVMKLTVESINGDVANLSAEYDASHQYSTNLEHFAEMTKVWARLDVGDDRMAGLYPIVDDGTHSSCPMFFKDWSNEKKAALKGEGDYFEINNMKIDIVVVSKSYDTPLGERTCIVYDASGEASETVFIQNELSKDFTYRDFADTVVLDSELGILWKLVAFGPIEINSSIYEYE